jgi:hypothetical protein
VLYPPSNRAPEAVVHFMGGAFVGAAPQISYRLFLEALANRNILVRFPRPPACLRATIPPGLKTRPQALAPFSSDAPLCTTPLRATLQ